MAIVVETKNVVCVEETSHRVILTKQVSVETSKYNGVCDSQLLRRKSQVARLSAQLEELAEQDVHSCRSLPPDETTKACQISQYPHTKLSMIGTPSIHLRAGPTG